MLQFLSFFLCLLFSSGAALSSNMNIIKCFEYNHGDMHSITTLSQLKLCTICPSFLALLPPPAAPLPFPQGWRQLFLIQLLHKDFSNKEIHENWNQLSRVRNVSRKQTQLCLTCSASNVHILLVWGGMNGREEKSQNEMN